MRRPAGLFVVPTGRTERPACVTSVQAFPFAVGSKDAALIVPLSAGQSYTVQASGADGGTGEALVEVYEVP